MNKKIRKFLVIKIKNMINIFGWLKLAIINKDQKPPIFEKSASQGLKIHIGSGEINIQGWVNIDARDFSHVHIVSKEISFNEFTDGSIQEVYLCHILEHLSFLELESVLHLINLKLKVGGVIRVSVPDFDKVIDIYQMENNNLDSVKHVLMGGQDYEFNFHKSVFNNLFLTNMLTQHNFNNVLSWDALTDFGVDLKDWSNGKIKTSGGNMPVSLNLKAEKSA